MAQVTITHVARCEGFDLALPQFLINMATEMLMAAVVTSCLDGITWPPDHEVLSAPCARV
jgi:hypothetical protein